MNTHPSQTPVEVPAYADIAALATVEAHKNKNAKIDVLVKKLGKKLNFLSKEKSKKFDESLKIFESLDTFVDIRGYLRQMNELNNESGTPNPKLPKLNLHGKHASTSLFTSPKSTRSPGASPKNHKGGKGVNVEIQKKIKTARQSLTNFMAKEDDENNLKRKENAYDFIVDETDAVLRKMTVMDKKSPLAEETDVDNFYKELQENLINDNFERMEHNVQLKPEEVNYYKNLLALKDEKHFTDKNYYDTYKRRADKVICLMRKATKNIFNKMYDPKSGRASKVLDDTKSEKEILDTRSSYEPKESGFKQQWKKHFESLIATGESLENIGSDKDLDANFQKMMEKMEKAHTKSMKIGSRATTTNFDKEKEKNMSVNQEINNAHKDQLKTIIESAQNNEKRFKRMRDDFKKKIHNLQDVYVKETQKLFPNNEESIKKSLGARTARPYMEKPIRKNLTMKVLNALG